MIKLNPKLRDALAVVTPYSDKPGLFPAIESGGLDMRGLSRNELLGYIDELQEKGMLAITEIAEDGSDFVILLTSDGATYFRESKVEIVRTVARGIFQLMLGASGGLVVWILGTLAS